MPLAPGTSTVGLAAAQVALHEESPQDFAQGRHVSDQSAAECQGGEALEFGFLSFLQLRV